MAVHTFHPLRVAAVEQLCEDAVAITFAVPDELAAAYAFRPGQSLTVRRTAGERRTYSICAPAGGPLRIGVRQVPGGAISGWLVNDLRPGDLVEVAPPAGSFTPDPGQGGRHVLVAAGSGITPILSIAASVLTGPATQVSLLYGNREARTVMFAEELADLKDAHPARFELVHVLSREPREADVLTGRLDAPRLRTLLRHLVPVPDVDHWWLCGPFGLVTDAIDVLGEFGVPAGRVHRELFYAGDPPPPPRRDSGLPAGPASEVTVVLDGRSTTVSVPAGDTILDGAQRSRPDLPFACKGGVCGTCRARIAEGQVRMRRNFALEPAELAAGYVLTCQSEPVTDTVVADYDA